MHGWSGYDDVGRGGHASFHGLFVLFCAWVRFNSDPFNACNGEAIWGVVEVGSMENMQEGEKLLVNNRQMMCVLGLMVREEWIVVMTRNSLLLFVDKRCGDSEYTLHRTRYE